MAVLTYRCPHCRTTIDVSEDLIGEAIVCPAESCRRPMELEAKTAKLVASSNGREGRSAEHSVDMVEAGDEREVEEMHPSMARRHPLRFAATMLGAVGGLVGSLWFLAVGDIGFSILLGIVGLTVAMYFFVWWLQVIHTTLVLTTKRLILRKGIIAKATTEVRHDDIRNLQVDQTMFERLLGVGDIAASSAGQDNIEIIARGFRNPQGVVERIRALQD